MVQFIKLPKFSSELINIPLQKNETKKFVQYFGDVAAGFPSPASDFEENSISLDEILIQYPEATYLNRVGGDSMSPEYIKGDLLIVRSDLDPQHNDDIVVSVNSSEYTFKRFDKINNRLVSLNPKYDNCIQLDKEDVVIVLGVVTAMVRQKRKF